MSEQRLIDANRLIDFIDCGHLRNPLELCFSESEVVNMLDSAPTIPAEVVVHCENCQRKDTTACPAYDAPFCRTSLRIASCSCGKRRESEESK